MYCFVVFAAVERNILKCFGAVLGEFWGIFGEVRIFVHVYFKP